MPALPPAPELKPSTVSRRQLFGLAAALALAPSLATAAGKKALFWQLRGPGEANGVLFGYERINANLAPDVVADGNGYVDAAKQILVDVGPKVVLPKSNLDRKAITPILKLLDAQTADRLRAIFSTSPQLASVVDTLSGVEATVLLMGEGQHRPEPTVGGVIMGSAKQKGLAVRQLVSDEEFQELGRNVDLTAINRAIDQPKIAYLLETRHRVGPIGAHLEKLYVQRQSDELQRFNEDVRLHGIPTPGLWVDQPKLTGLLLARLTDQLRTIGPEPFFAMAPISLLTGQQGLLAALAARDIAVSLPS
ncbi:hypothetical protein [Mesorhizobium sp. SP-1A]|uniref:hypothetical protein n=1 Tax=Mesorhizobium sp. SP-1A TaxID=3077840 RepID=UPI0028F74533|nr:hypothetical protein [Mesorhizobium sp. SP-1A]